MNEVLFLVLLLFTKHFIIDFPLQTCYQYSNKGTYGHLGGILHAWLHGLGTYLCFVWINPITAIYLAVADMLIHYHVDWAKMNLNSKFNWSPTIHDQFWWLLGFDQYLHAITYIMLIGFVV